MSIITFFKTVENPFRKYRYSAYFLSKIKFLRNKKRFYECKKYFLEKYPEVKYLSDTRYFSGYSQKGQDILIYNTFFNNKKKGLFFDIGANHPIRHNNTYYFEKKGWSGYAFEPVSKAKELWKNLRKAKFFPYAVTSAKKILNFKIYNLYDIPQTSFISTQENKDNQEYHSVEVQGVSIKDICEQENISFIDYVSIDVEGHDLEVLKGIDFNQVKVSVFTIENNREALLGSEEIRKFMKSKNYRFYARIHLLDDIYVSNDFQETT